MIKRVCLIILFISIECICKIFIPNNISYPNKDNLNDRVVVNKAFKVGEKLEFDLNYGFINAGSASIEIARIDTVNGRNCFVIATKARSRSSFDWIYKVRDYSESYLDSMRFHSLKFFKKVREGSYKIDINIEYDQANGKAYYKSKRYKKNIQKKSRIIKIPDNVIDALSALFFVRTMDFKVGDEIILPGTNNKKVYPMKIIVHKKDKISVKAGEFNCIVVEPIMANGAGIFKNEGSIKVWLTDDKYKMPVKMESKVFVGSIKAELTKYRKFIKSN